MPSLSTTKAFGTSPASDVWFTNDSANFHGWMLVKYVFEFAWVDTEVLGFDEVFLAVSNVEVAVLVHVVQCRR